MNIKSNGAYSFTLESKSGNISFNPTIKNESDLLDIYSTLQKDNTDIHTFSWPGEYERAGVATTLLDVNGSHNIAKLVIESVMIAFFNTSEVRDITSITEKIGISDVLVFEKSGESISKEQAKKLIEEIDPRVVIFSGEDSKVLASSLGYPIEAVDKVSFSSTDFSAEKTLFYSL